LLTVPIPPPLPASPPGASRFLLLIQSGERPERRPKIAGHKNRPVTTTGTADLIDELGELFEVTQTIIKKWTTGGPIQSPLDALVNLRKQSPFDAGDVKQVVVRLSTSAAPKVDNSQSPDLCLQYLVAVMLLDRTVSFRAAHDKARMQDPAILRERAKVQVIAEERLEQLLPRRVAVVEVMLNDGTRLSEQNDTVRGTPENPMTRDEIVEKARDLVTPVLGVQACAKLIESVLALDEIKNIRELRPLLQRT
jgi:2-methylcitrate dehydratase PrpD